MARTPTVQPEIPRDSLLPSHRAERAVRAEAALREALLRIDELTADLARCRSLGQANKRLLDRYQAGDNMRKHS
ncbi:MAG: hypothetical protein RJA98_688 [Pseudomonadota bacterium]|jgi:hypothetical protein